MVDSRTAPYAALLLRVSMGIMFLAHAWLKIGVFGIDGTVRFFGSLGLPAFMAYATIALEIIAGVAFILGVWARAIALVMAVEMLAIIYLVQWSKGWVFSAPGGGWEFPAFWAAALVALALLGDGAHALVRTPVGRRQGTG